MLSFAIVAWRADRGRASPSAHAFMVLTLLTFVAMGIYLLLTAGSAEVTGETISYRSPIARYQINLSEVMYIEIDSSGNRIVFCGENKRLAVLGRCTGQGAIRKEFSTGWAGKWTRGAFKSGQQKRPCLASQRIQEFETRDRRRKSLNRSPPDFCLIEVYAAKTMPTS